MTTDELMSTARAVAERIAANPPLAVRYTKAAVNQQIKAAMTAGFETAAALELATFLSDDHAEAIDAAVSGRRPQFEGK